MKPNVCENPSDNPSPPQDIILVAENNCLSPQAIDKDDERYLIELMVASSTIPKAPQVENVEEVKYKNDKTGNIKSDPKKRAKIQRDLNRELSLLNPDYNKISEEKDSYFAEAYFIKVKDRLDENTFQEFLQVLCSFDNKKVTVRDLYLKVMDILKQHSDLTEEFVVFLLPGQAIELGVYMQYLTVAKMRDFLRKVEVYFSKHPLQVRKIYEGLAKLVDQSVTGEISISTIRNTMLPLLKGSTLLTDYFLQLFPYEQPSAFECSDCDDFEKVDCIDFNENDIGKSTDWETVEMPDLDDPFEGDNCSCTCHNKVSPTSNHCFSCGITFINGRVFFQSGKVLRRAKLVIEGKNKREVIERISKKLKKNKDETKEIRTLKRKRISADSSPVKNRSVEIGSPNLTSPYGTDEEDLLEPKHISCKNKVARNIDRENILKPIYKTRLVVKNSGTHSDDGSLSNPYVVLDNINPENDNKNDKVSDVALSKESSMIQCSSHFTDSTDAQDDDDDDDDEIEYVEIDEDDDDEDEIIDIDDDEEDDYVEDIDDEEDDIEVIENDDDEDDDDIEVIDDDDDEDDDMDVEYLSDDEDDSHQVDKRNGLNNKFVDSIDFDNVVIKEEKEEIDDKTLIVKDFPVVKIENVETFLPKVDVKIEALDNDLKNSDNLENYNCLKECLSNNNENSENSSPKSVLRLNLSNGQDKDCKIVEKCISENTYSECLENTINLKGNSEHPLSENNNHKKDIENPLTGNDNQNNCVNHSIEIDDNRIGSTVENIVEVNENRLSTSDTLNLTSEQTKDVESEVTDPNSFNKDVMSSQPSQQPIRPSSFWTKEEDKVILQTFQQEGDPDENFIMITKQLPQRSVDEIKSRFNILMQLLKRMTTNKNVD